MSVRGVVRVCIAGAVGIGIGVVVGRLLPPFVLDDPFWQAFLTSASLGGVAAFLAAVVAFCGVAYSVRRVAENSRSDREQRQIADARAHFWVRFSWAAEKAVDPDQAELGILVLSQLIEQEWVTIEDNRAAIAVADVVLAAPVEEAGPADSDGGVR